MKLSRHICFLLILCLLLAGCSNSTTGAEIDDVQKAMTELVAAYNSTEGNKIITKYTITDFTYFDEGESDLINANASQIGNPSNPENDKTSYEHKLKIEDINVNGNSAFLTGYIFGNLWYFNKGNSYGSRRFTSVWVRQKDGWKQSHLHLSKYVELQYFIHLPADYEKDSTKKWPVILQLHGSGERGDNLEMVKQTGLPKITEKDKSFPFIAVYPQCPLNTTWAKITDALDSLLDDIEEKYRVDKDRVYLTGYSMGGNGTWELAMAHPERFAAIAPICAWGNTSTVKNIKDIPVWAFHGDRDPTVPWEAGQYIVNALKNVGGNVKFTLYPDEFHDVWTMTYDNPELYKWFLQNSKGN